MDFQYGATSPYVSVHEMTGSGGRCDGAIISQDVNKKKFHDSNHEGNRKCISPADGPAEAIPHRTDPKPCSRKRSGELQNRRKRE
jgi:hypothetical protein